MSSMYDPMLYLRHVDLLREQVPSFDTYPYNLPVVRALERIAFQKQVTFLVGRTEQGNRLYWRESQPPGVQPGRRNAELLI